MNTTEQMVYDCLVKDFGSIWDSVDESIINEKLPICKQLFNSASRTFATNPSAYNYNILNTAMMVLQYWNQKRVNSFTVEAEF
jgi:hypothetical protein